MYKYSAIAVLVGLLAACAQQAPTPSPAMPPAAGACNAAGAQFALGGAANAALVEEARVRSGSYIARVIQPGQAVTMEFNAMRLNLEVNGANTVMRARCG
ncbi:MAG: I78 family peptidase inhibitor [Pseudomonadota bacterium]